VLVSKQPAPEPMTPCRRCAADYCCGSIALARRSHVWKRALDGCNPFTPLQAVVKFKAPLLLNNRPAAFSVGRTVFDASQKAQCGYFAVIGGALALAASSKARPAPPRGAVALVGVAGVALGVQMSVLWPVLKARAVALETGEKELPPAGSHGWWVATAGQASLSANRSEPAGQHRPASALLTLPCSRYRALELLKLCSVVGAGALLMTA
jgi:xanthosine utilization system XapX-like protein